MNSAEMEVKLENKLNENIGWETEEIMGTVQKVYGGSISHKP